MKADIIPKPDPRLDSIHFRCSVRTKRALKLLAAKEQRTPSDLVRVIVEDELRQRGLLR